MFGRNPEERFKKLARNLEAMERRDRARVAREQELEELRQKAALELHGICTDFASRVNKISESVKLEVSPASFSVDGFGEGQVQLIQIGVNGRMIQFTFQSTPEMESTEEIRFPYTLEGSIRWFNQEMLERDEVKDHMLYYCMDRNAWAWRWFDFQSRKLELVTDDYLADRLEELI
ncbi:MAG: hypothetical protein R2729_14165 [Bryobacteraceae bacterium]